MNYTIQDIDEIARKHNLYQNGFLKIDDLYLLLDVSIRNKNPSEFMTHIQVFEDNAVSLSRSFFLDPISFYMKAYALYFTINGINKNICFKELYKDARSDPDIYKANCFAENITMPQKHILLQGKILVDTWKDNEKKRVFFKRRKKMPQSEFIKNMSELFSVNSTIMTNRLKQLNIIE